MKLYSREEEIDYARKLLNRLPYEEREEIMEAVTDKDSLKKFTHDELKELIESIDDTKPEKKKAPTKKGSTNMKMFLYASRILIQKSNKAIPTENVNETLIPVSPTVKMSLTIECVDQPTIETIIAQFTKDPQKLGAELAKNLKLVNPTT